MASVYVILSFRAFLFKQAISLEFGVKNDHYQSQEFVCVCDNLVVNQLLIAKCISCTASLKTLKTSGLYYSYG